MSTPAIGTRRAAEKIPAHQQRHDQHFAVQNTIGPTKNSNDSCHGCVMNPRFTPRPFGLCGMNLQSIAEFQQN
jgi:hypothetical protein